MCRRAKQQQLHAYSQNTLNDHTCNYILSKKKTSFFEKINQTRSILIQFTQDLHLLIAYHQTKTLIITFSHLMPPFPRNGSFLFVLQSQPFYNKQLGPVTTISILRSSLAPELKRPKSVHRHYTKRDHWEA